MFAYGTVETVLAEVFGATSPPTRSRLKSKIKQFQKLGIPLGVRPGKGQKTSYDREQIYQFAFCLELAEFGMDPTFVVRIIQRYWRHEDAGLFDNLKAAESDTRDDDNDRYVAIAPAVMSSSWHEGGFSGFTHYRWFRRSDADLFVRNVFGGQRRAAVVNATVLVRAIQEALRQHVEEQ